MLNDQYVSDFSFLGKRNYIQAHKLLEFAIKSLNDYHRIKGNIQISYFNVHHEAEFNVRLAYEKSGDVSAIAGLKYFSSGGWNTVYLCPTNNKISTWVEDEIVPVNIVSCDGSFSGVGRIGHVCSFWDVLAGIVEINKQLHFASLKWPVNDPKIRAVYFKKFLIPDLTKLTSLVVNLECIGSRSFQDIEYSMSKVSWWIGDIEYRIEISFAYKRL